MHGLHLKVSFYFIGLLIVTTYNLQIFKSASEYTDFPFAYMNCTKELFTM